ncbi:MAG: hypothetical protein LBR11_08185 [Deltaproteobacteria bacterium]|jgi:hypothetical protein|nr:hypothetical protein [Deltaproteobacteria bacterium]
MSSFPEDNYLFAEQLIIDRLKQVMPPEINVGSIGDYADLAQSKVAFPNVSVLYLGDDPVIHSANTPGQRGVNTAGNGIACQVVQYWGVVVGTKEPTTAKTGFASRTEGGKLMLKVLKVLQGFEILPCMYLTRGLFRGNSSIYNESGYTFLTAQFNLTLDVVGEK